ncbi:hypothetical protein AAFF_G00140320 [Aldrovandia affinis]|uniref:Uncharacterized protein n=1 Tax=Aldrovandia affinis TaxID=143900 RepID=A0AAD7TDL2_9TELE|nr:hypothetical protein AAFF_G00140320 [Aldrovandia affinis]
MKSDFQHVSAEALRRILGCKSCKLERFEESLRKAPSPCNISPVIVVLSGTSAESESGLQRAIKPTRAGDRAHSGSQRCYTSPMICHLIKPAEFNSRSAPVSAGFVGPAVP